VTRVTLAACLRVDTHLGAWLFTVARNVHVSYRRSRAFEESDGSIGLWPVQRPASPFEQTAATELEGRIETALASLPVASREVLLLVGVEGMRPSEAAAVCGVSPDALRQRLKRARELLAERMNAPRGRRASNIAMSKVHA
jgi:RNA polymerase sigma-70 factor (ECF subfamily)